MTNKNYHNIVVVWICILFKPGLKKKRHFLILFELKARFHMAIYCIKLKPYNQTHFTV